MSAMHYSYTDDHDELITALLAGRWWAIMEVEDLLHSSSKNECGDLTLNQRWGKVEAPEEAPVTLPQCQQGELVPARSLEENQEEVPAGAFTEVTPVPTLGQEEAPVLILSPEKALESDESLKGAPVPARHKLRGKLEIPPNMRLYVTRHSISTPLPLRPPKGPPLRPAKPLKGAPVLALSPGEAHVPTRCPEEPPVPTSAQAPVPASSTKKTPVASSPLKEASVPISSLEEALVAEGAPVTKRHRMKVSENMRLFLKRDVIMTPLPLRPPKGPPPRPAKALKGASVPASSAEEIPVLSVYAEKGPVPTSKEEAPVSTENTEEALVPARSPEKEGAPVTIASSKEAPMPAVSLKRPCPWSTEDFESADVVQPPPQKKCVRKDPRASPSFQKTLKRPCPWSTETSDSGDVIQLQKKQRVGKGPKDTIN